MKPPFGDLLYGFFWLWMLLVSGLFTHKSDTSKQMFQTFSYAPVSAPISGWQIIWRQLQCFQIDANDFTLLNNTQCFHVFCLQAQMNLNLSKSEKPQPLLRTSRSCPPQ